MALTTMYPAQNNSPATSLTAALNSSDTTMTVDNASVLPAAPNLAVIGSSDDAEIVLYTAITGNNITIVRGQNGTTPGTWSIGAPVARNFTSADHEAFRENILDLDSRKIEGVAWGDITGTLSDQTDLANALGGKQDSLTFDIAPTAASTNPVESGGVYTALSNKQNTLTDSGWLEHTNEMFTGTIYYRKIGNLVEITAYQIKLKNDFDSGYSISLGTLPSGYRPNEYSAAFFGGSRTSWAQIVIGTNGTISFYKPSDVATWSSSTNINFTGMYIA